MITQVLFENTTEDPNRNKMDLDNLANAPDLTEDYMNSWEGTCDGYIAMSSFIRH